MTDQLFKLGHTVATPNAIETLRKAGVDTAELLDRHIIGDFGDLCDEDAQQNKLAINHDMRIMSSYQVAGQEVWVITEADRSSTTILLPGDY